ncbi:hypothetical protein BTH42_19660 [Burkholderia sp. SRS-W-2-2016]|nr:hypothetical protein BTH42_19660 [Burkholderia sp. SRS-W-2-2016]
MTVAIAALRPESRPRQAKPPTHRCDDDTPRFLYRPIGKLAAPPACRGREQSLTLKRLCAALLLS